MDISFGLESGRVSAYRTLLVYVPLTSHLNSVALGNSKGEIRCMFSVLSIVSHYVPAADIVKIIDSQPDLAAQLRRVRGGYLKIQGTWMPYEIALRLARR